MARHHFRLRSAAIVVPALVVLASCGLTACGSSASDPATTQTRALSPQEAAIRQAGITELVDCARRHGIQLPTNAAGVNVSGVKGHSREHAVGECYHKVIREIARRTRAIQRKQAEPQAAP